MDQNAKVFLRQFEELFALHFSHFTFYAARKPAESYAYYFNYKAYKISIVIFLPLSIDATNDLIMQGRNIRVLLKKSDKTITKYMVELRDTPLIDGWESRLIRKITILQELVSEVHMCQKCNSYKLPGTYRTKKERTMFVSLKCQQCHEYTSTTFGRGLKTLLHKNLKRSRSQ